MYKYLLILLSINCYSEEVFVKYQVNVANGSVADAKALGVGYVRNLWILKNKYEVGKIFDNRKGAKDSFYSFMGLGIQPEVGPIYFNFFQNIGGITTKDSYLGGHFQFCEELGVGVKGRDNTTISLFYKHISNAGIQKPNMGKDFGGLQIGLPF